MLTDLDADEVASLRNALIHCGRALEREHAERAAGYGFTEAMYPRTSAAGSA